jgi:hypothetical protein
MTAVYPGALATIAANKEDDTDAGDGSDGGVSTSVGDHAAHHNQLAEELVAVQDTLGIDPQGPYATDLSDRMKRRDSKMSVRAASTGSMGGTYSNGPPATFVVAGASLVLDGYTTVDGDRVLLKDMAAPERNGIYTVSGLGGANVTLTRAFDADTVDRLSGGSMVYVTRGTTQRDTVWGMTADTPVTLGTSPIYFSRFMPSYTPGNWRAPHGRSGDLYENVPRFNITSTLTLGTAATTYWFSGLVLAAGITITNVNVSITTAGTAPSVRWFALVDAATRVVLARTNNSTTIWAANAINQAALSAPYTPIADVPIFVVMGNANPTTAAIMAATPGTINPALASAAPFIARSGGSTPTSTPPAVGTSITASTTNLANLPWISLS